MSSAWFGAVNVFLFFFFALCSVRWDPVDWKHCPRYWWPCLWCMYCFMIIPKPSFFLTHKKKTEHLSSEQYALSLLVSICKDKLISCFRQAGWNSYYINKPKEWGFSIPNQTVTLASQNEIWIIICISSAIQDFCCTL